MEKPKLLIIAGPNGSGKTTFTGMLLNNHWSEDCVFINPDEIANKEFGDWNSAEAVIKAAKRATEYRMQCLAEGKSMVLETVLSREDKVDFIRQARESGFFVRIFFIGTDDPRINAERVGIRVENGGHTVPLDKIFTRYYRSLALFIYAAKIADRSYAYDNSTYGQEPVPLFRTRDGVIIKKYPGLREHRWAQELAGEIK
jgi:predicted ABC-type ATPase